ncbi:2,3-dihydro-2,3-dihydroxybenzoate dehydrogenase [Stenotrophomonas sp. YAU14D1_LEIMI4_1]|uniref:2,3-dihydro-2,3-dihydroxybenzoate dehydrogenase n=1 Tax=Stenotrophomonas sp. YAU14D1_LEIMI4_1 TaxID=2072407 RepID=UPI000D53E4E0|nr:2,3-dihydro-2,3-dihydroxybenzoate dehydrogenase [Stenotrophomonas sp. YAU14D1_LEIMI4_1]AWH25545.1 2,3-dihydro-2,3-dihydroxybenzoate dehydrogenase [Stenotrophomonas sp. YAU14D1_LEIMI4_1]
MQLTGFAGRVALVTGAGGGIGAALVELLAAAGCTVVATDLAAPAAQSRGVHAFALDVTDSGAVDALVDEVEARIGPIALVANVAGVLHVGEVVQTTDADWRRVFAVNAEGVFHVSRAVARVMSPRRHGALVTVSSNAAGVPRHGMAAYAASKAAATMFTRCLGLELAPLGIRCNIVAPGSTLTPMQTGMWEDAQGAERVIAGNLDTYKAGIPLRKLATPDNIAHSVMFLLSEQAGHVAMSDLYVDGGATLRG